MLFLRRVVSMFPVAALLLGAGAAFGPEFPGRPIRFMIPLAPGGGADGDDRSGLDLCNALIWHD